MSTPVDPAINQQFWNNVNQISQQPNGLTAPKPQFTYPKPTNIVLPNPTLANAPGSSYYNGADTGGDTDSLSRLMNAIKSQESNGNYAATNPSGAEGAYQILQSNIPSWSQEALGHSITNQQFMSSDSDQDTIAKYMLGKYLNQYGLAGAAAAWYGGPGAVANMNDKTPYGGYPSMYDYVQSILSKYGAY